MKTPDQKFAAWSGVQRSNGMSTPADDTAPSTQPQASRDIQIELWAKGSPYDIARAIDIFDAQCHEDRNINPDFTSSIAGSYYANPDVNPINVRFSPGLQYIPEGTSRPMGGITVQRIPDGRSRLVVYIPDRYSGVC